VSDVPHLPTDQAPWAPLGATRVGGAIGALVGVSAVINFGDGAAWFLLLAATLGAAVGYGFDRHSDDQVYG
jgi:hypothetical protein